MDRAGNIAVGFNAMSKRDFSSVYVAGRKPSDPAGAMFGPLRLATAAACSSIPTGAGAITAA
jgi:hypothetical protein